jgi:hypothetical protein
MPPRSAPLALFCVLATQGGCASKLDFDALSSEFGQRDAASEDSTRDASGLRPLDAGEAGPLEGPAVTGSTPEAGTPSSTDGGGDAQATELVPEPAMFSCAAVSPEPAFCDDFETPDSLNDWNGTIVDPLTPQPGGSLAADGVAARAGTRSLLATTAPDLVLCDDCGIHVLGRVLFFELVGPQRVRIDFDLRVEAIDSVPSRRIALFQFVLGTPENGVSQHTLQLESLGKTIKSGFVEFETEPVLAGATELPASASAPESFKAGPALDEWVHVRYELDAVDSSGPGNSAHVEVGPTVLFDGPLWFPLHYREPTLELGVPFVDFAGFGADDRSNGWRVRYDNVLVRIEPR